VQISGTGSEVCFRRKDGSTFWAAVFISPIRAKSGDVVRIDVGQPKFPGELWRGAMQSPTQSP
jgi:hypothetical protein